MNDTMCEMAERPKILTTIYPFHIRKYNGSLCFCLCSLYGQELIGGVTMVNLGESHLTHRNKGTFRRGEARRHFVYRISSRLYFRGGSHSENIRVQLTLSSHKRNPKNRYK